MAHNNEIIVLYFRNPRKNDLLDAYICSPMQETIHIPCLSFLHKRNNYFSQGKYANQCEHWSVYFTGKDSYCFRIKARIIIGYKRRKVPRASKDRDLCLNHYSCYRMHYLSYRLSFLPGTFANGSTTLTK